MSKEFHQSAWDALVADECRRLVRAAVLEDLDRGQDWTTLSLTPMEATGRADIVARQSGVVAGLPAVLVVIDEMDRRLRMEAVVADGTAVDRGTVIATVEGPARSLLTAERLMLNFLGRLSGIATQTRQFVDAVAETKARIYDTRKTTPGWRRLEKYAVQQGGGCNHRTGLFDAVLIKDNHLALGAALAEFCGEETKHPHPGPLPRGEGVGGFTPAGAVRQVQEFLAVNFPADDPRRDMIVEVEVDSLVVLKQVLTEQPDIVLLDNMNLDDLRRAVEIRNATAPEVELEASGGVSLQTVAAIAKTGVDRISAGVLTHSAAWFDVALDWQS